jgi:hypothetical protein
MGPEIIVPVMGIICVIGLPIWTAHQRSMMAMKLKLKDGANDSTVAEVRALKEQIAELRDTTTRYDMSFDAALQRIESRVSHVEGKVNSLEAGKASQITQDVR